MPSPVTGMASRRALVVAADMATHRLCRAALETSGLAVDGVDSGMAALMSAREARPVLIVIDQQPRLQLLDIDAAIEHCARGASVWQWASTDRRAEPDVVLACAGGVPTLETVAAAWWLRKKAPDLNVRVVNVVDLTALFAPEFHPHGMGERPFVELFTTDTPVVFASHGDQHALHQIVGGRPNPRRFHMLTGNGMSRFDLCAEALRRVARGRLPQVRELITECHASIAAAAAYSHEHLDDSPEIRNWVWTD